MTFTNQRSRVYLEEDCPVAELSVESQRERGAVSALPAIYFLHVWWARRPLTVSRATVVGSLLPPTYSREEFLELIGVPRGKDAVAEKARLDVANQRGEKLKVAYSYQRGFASTIPARAVEKMRSSIKEQWGTDRPSVLDSFAGGGSIPLEAYRLGFNAVLNELNPVACVVERATIDYPARFGPSLSRDIETWGERIGKTIEKELRDVFPRAPGEEIFAYIWVRTVPCSSCELLIPLSPNWWLDRAGKLGYSPQVPARGAGSVCTFTVRHQSSAFDPDAGTITAGTATCPRCAASVEGDEIKRYALQGQLRHQLAAVGFKVDGKTGKFFRAPTQDDLAGVDRAEKRLAAQLPEWTARGLVPTEDIPPGNKTKEPLSVGVAKWAEMFSPRQLLVHLTVLDTILGSPWAEVSDASRREALRVYMALAFDKSAAFNCVTSRWHSGRLVVAPQFERHDFSFKWSYAEFDGASALWGFTISQEVKATKELASLPRVDGGSATYSHGDAANLPFDSGSIEAIVIDPPYYDNVMYAELSDFFYVWMKRSLGDVFPELFRDELTDKDAEAVANVARFKTGKSGGARRLADADYTAKMLGAFSECHRVLRDDGVLSIMFTHKRVDAWDSLGRALIDAGFEITATWPVHTESEHSLHQAKKNAASSTILLICRKRNPSAGQVWWEDIQSELRTHVRERAEKFASMGLRGQDTSIASFGPALQVISRQWPVKRKDGSVIRPEEALDLAREEVMTWLFERIAEGQVRAVDKWTRFYILSWFVFGAREFPYDEARKLALALKVDIDKELIPHRVLEKKSNNVKLLTPKERAQKGQLDPAKRGYDWDLDYVQAAIQAYDHGMGGELSKFHQRTGALTREGYKNAIGYLLDVLPRTKEVVEYHSLDKLWEGNLQDQVKRRKPRLSDPTFEKQQRLTLANFGDQEAELEEPEGDTSQEGEDGEE